MFTVIIPIIIRLVLLLKLSSSMNVVNNDIENEIRGIRGILIQQQKEIRELQLEKHAYWAELRDLRNENQELRGVVEKLNAAVAQLQQPANSDDAEFRVSDISTESHSSVQEEIVEPSFSTSKGKRQITSPIAFYVYMSHTESAPSLHHMLIFDTIKTNLGGGFNKHSGMFTVPSTGVYVFTWTIYTGDNGKTAFALYVNHSIVSTTYGETDDDDGDYDSDSGTAVLSLNENDNVYIKSIRTCTTDVPSNDSWNARTTFAGWKLD